MSESSLARELLTRCFGCATPDMLNASKRWRNYSKSINTYGIICLNQKLNQYVAVVIVDAQRRHLSLFSSAVSLLMIMNPTAVFCCERVLLTYGTSRKERLIKRLALCICCVEQFSFVRSFALLRLLLLFRFWWNRTVSGNQNGVRHPRNVRF